MKREKESGRKIKMRLLQKVEKEVRLLQLRAKELLHQKEHQLPRRKMLKPQRLHILNLKTMSTTISRNSWTILQVLERS